jgi:predicted RNase H-like HicB family nuclease
MRSSRLPGSRARRRNDVINLPYSLVIEATEEPDYFGFFSTELEGFSGIGYSVEDCLYKARWGMQEHVELLRERHLPVPATNPNPTVIIRNEQRRSVA